MFTHLHGEEFECCEVRTVAVLTGTHRRQLATLVAQLFSCSDGEHCFIQERAHWQLFCCGNKKVAA